MKCGIALNLNASLKYCKNVFANWRQHKTVNWYFWYGRKDKLKFSSTRTIHISIFNHIWLTYSISFTSRKRSHNAFCTKNQFLYYKTCLMISLWFLLTKISNYYKAFMKYILYFQAKSTLIWSFRNIVAFNWYLIFLSIMLCLCQIYPLNRSIDIEIFFLFHVYALLTFVVLLQIYLCVSHFFISKIEITRQH